jgi:hypothetical protein
LCSDQDALRKMAATESHQACTGDSKNSQKPCQMPNTSSSRISYEKSVFVLDAFLLALTLCNKTPRLMFARVMHDSITSEPTSKPCAHASRINSFMLVGFSTTFPRAIRLGTGLMMVAEFSRTRALLAEDACCDVTFGNIDYPPSTFYHDRRRNVEDGRARAGGLRGSAGVGTKTNR